VALQLKSQLPPVQLAVECAGTGQAAQLAPQLDASSSTHWLVHR
jgi:hypothetical protein